MEYRAKDHFERATRLLLNGLMSVGAIGIAWNLLKPGGWLFRIVDLIARYQPASFYYLAVAGLGLLAATIWLDNIDSRVFYDLLAATSAFAGTLFILSLLLPL